MFPYLKVFNSNILKIIFSIIIDFPVLGLLSWQLWKTLELIIHSTIKLALYMLRVFNQILNFLYCQFNPFNQFKQFKQFEQFNQFKQFNHSYQSNQYYTAIASALFTGLFGRFLIIADGWLINLCTYWGVFLGLS